MNVDGVVRLCQMSSDLSKMPLTNFEKHKSPWYAFCDKQPSYYTCSYEIRFIMQAAVGVESELWFKNQKYNEVNSFKVDWQEGTSVSAPREIPSAVEHNYDRFRR